MLRISFSWSLLNIKSHMLCSLKLRKESPPLSYGYSWVKSLLCFNMNLNMTLKIYLSVTTVILFWYGNFSIYCALLITKILTGKLIVITDRQVSVWTLPQIFHTVPCHLPKAMTKYVHDFLFGIYTMCLTAFGEQKVFFTWALMKKACIILPQ